MVEPARDIYSSTLIKPGIWLIEDFNKDSMYLVEGEKKALLIDTGMGTGDLAGFVRSLTALPLEVVIAHGHLDHAGQADQFGKVYMSHKDAAISFGKWTSPNASSFIDLNEGFIFDLGGRTLEVLEVPGHTPGSIALLDPADRILFTSDAIGSSFVWMQINGTTYLTEYLESVKKLEARRGEYDRILPGHYNQSNGVQLTSQYVTDMRLVVEKLMDGEIVAQPYPLGREDDGYKASYASASVCFATDKISPDEAADPTKYIVVEVEPGVISIKDRAPYVRSNMYLIMGREKALLIDTGYGSGDLRGLIGRLIGNLKLEVVITHGHGDHANQADQFDKVYMPLADIPVLQAKWPGLDTSRFIDVRDGDSFDLGGRIIKVIGMRGHTPGHITLLDEENGLLFTGDAIGTRGDGGGLWLQDSELFIDEFLVLLKEFKDRIDGKFEKILTGHNAKTVYPGYLDYVIAAAQKVVDEGEAALIPSIRPEGLKMVVYGQKDDPYVASINVNPKHLLSPAVLSKRV